MLIRNSLVRRDIQTAVQNFIADERKGIINPWPNGLGYTIESDSCGTAECYYLQPTQKHHWKIWTSYSPRECFKLFGTRMPVISW